MKLGTSIRETDINPWTYWCWKRNWLLYITTDAAYRIAWDPLIQLAELELDSMNDFRIRKAVRMKYNEATEKLGELWSSIVKAHQGWRDAERLYIAAARDAGVRLCCECSKPMPDYDNSQSCDGCQLEWGWSTPQGLQDARAAQLDREINRLQKERDCLRNSVTAARACRPQS